jgi:hypothetical protein
MSIIKSQIFTLTGVSDWIPAPALSKVMQATLQGGSGGATINIEASNDKVGIQQIGATITLAAAGNTGFQDVTANWNYVRFNVTNLGGGTVLCTAAGALSAVSGTIL